MPGTRKTAKKKPAKKLARRGGKPAKKLARRGGKPVKKKRSKRWLTGQVSKRQRYASPEHYEAMYAAWRDGGTIAQAVRLLNSVEGFEQLDYRTLRSVYLECKADWEDRKAKDLQAVAIVARERYANEIAEIELQEKKLLAETFLALAKVGKKKLPLMLRVLADEVEDGNITGQDLAYGVPKLIDSFGKLAKEQRGPAVRIDARSVQEHRHVHLNPARAAKTMTKAELLKDLQRKAHELDGNRV